MNWSSNNSISLLFCTEYQVKIYCRKDNNHLTQHFKIIIWRWTLFCSTPPSGTAATHTKRESDARTEHLPWCTRGVSSNHRSFWCRSVTASRIFRSPCQRFSRHWKSTGGCLSQQARGREAHASDRCVNSMEFDAKADTEHEMVAHRDNEWRGVRWKKSNPKRQNTVG